MSNYNNLEDIMSEDYSDVNYQFPPPPGLPSTTLNKSSPKKINSN